MRIRNNFDRRYWVFFLPATATLQSIPVIYSIIKHGGFATRRGFFEPVASTLADRLIGTLPIILINVALWFIAIKVFHWMDGTYATADRFAMTPDERTEHHQKRLWKALNQFNLKQLVLNASLNLDQMGEKVDQITLSFIFEHDPTPVEIADFERALLEYQTTAPHPEFRKILAIGPSKQPKSFDHLVRKVPVDAMASGKTFINRWIRKKTSL